MNHETKKQAANDWLKQNEKGIAYEHESEIAIRAFKAGASWREGKAAKLLAEKDAEIERLKLHDIAGYQEGIDCLTIELSQAKELIKEMRAESMLLKESLWRIAKTDISETAPDFYWLQKWRERTKQSAQNILDRVSGMFKNAEKIEALLGEE